jgi:hypothetical protein
MFTRDFRIWGSVLIGWTLLFFIYPMIAMFIVGFGMSTFFFYIVLKAVRDGFIKVAFGFRVATCQRNQEPFLFWFFILFFISMRTLLSGMIIFGIYKKPSDLLIHYF